MSRTSRTTSSEQKNELQRDEATTSPDSTSMISGSSLSDTTRLTADAEQAKISEQTDAMLGKEDLSNEAPDTGRAKYKTLGNYMLLDPQTGDSVTEAGDEVRVTQFILRAEEEGRIEKA